MLCKEWVFRRTNQPEPSLATTWENYMDLDGLKIAQDHKKSDDSFHLYFSGLAVK